MLRNIKLTLEYDGTNFRGWQIQSAKERTIQGEIQNALKKILKTKINLFGSGRTDAGVHAQGQVANFKTISSMTLIEFKKALNANLPDDISILNVEEVALKFHAQYSATKKTYRYTILNRQVRACQDRHFCLHYPYKLNVTLMRKEIKSLVGRKDFKSFQSADPHRVKNTSTIRTIKKINLKKHRDYLSIEIEGTGFLYKMVRNIVGTLLEIGNGRLPKGSMSSILTKKNRAFAGIPAPARGLSLIDVKY